MRILLLLPFALSSFIVFGQNSLGIEPSTEISKSKEFERQLTSHERQLRLYDQKLILLKDNFNKENEALKTEIKSNLQQQAQNEAAVNIALDGFSKKFEDQNKTMDGVKSTLDRQWQQQLLFFGALLLIIIVSVFLGIQYSTRRALQKSKQSWNDFNAYILSGKYKE